MPASAEAPTRPRALGEPLHDRDRVSQRSDHRVRLGPLLAVCGLAGGAGATTLACLVALAAAQQLSESVLVADTGGPSGGLAALAGVEAPRSLPEVASQLATGLPLRGGLYVTGPAGVRVLAAGPEFSTRCAANQLKKLLADAREAHGLTVVDCGTLSRDVDQLVAGAATHLAWLMPATTHGVGVGQRVLSAAPAIPAKEIVIARADARQAKAPLRELRRIAAERQALLVLIPKLPGIECGRLDRAIKTAQVPVQAILGALKR